MSPIDAAILRTILYADVFHFPLTLDELHRYLISDRPIAKADLDHSLATSPTLQSIICAKDGYYCLHANQAIIHTRQERERISCELWDSAWWYGRLLSQIPFVEMVALTGALAVRNPASHADDFDYLLITQPRRVWLARFFAVVMVRIVRLFGRELCPNYVLASNQLQQSRQDLYMAHEVAQMQPIYGECTYQEITSQNHWITQFLPNVKPYAVQYDPPRRIRRVLEWVLGGAIGDWLERWEYRRKLNKFRPQLVHNQSNAELSANSVKGHFEDHGIPAMEQYYRRLEQYGLHHIPNAMAGD